MGLNLKATIGLDGSGFEAGLSKIKSAVGSIQSHIAGAFSVGAVIALSKRTLDYAGTLNDLSDRLGVSTDFLQEFQYAATQTGAKIERVATSMEAFRQSRDEALGGSETKLAQFQALGISKEQLQNTRIEDLISGPVVSALQSGDVQGAVGAAWRDLASRGSGELVAGLKDFTNLRKEARESAKFWTEDEIQQLDEIGDSFTRLGQALILNFGPIILKIVEIIRYAINNIQAAFNFYKAGLSNIFKTGKFDKDAAVGARDETFQKLEDKLDKEAKARAAKRALRANERATTQVESSAPPQQKKEEAFTAPTRTTDSLRSVGNFLGSGKDVLNNIAQQQLTVLQRIAINTDAMARARTGSTIDFSNV